MDHEPSDRRTEAEHLARNGDPVRALDVLVAENQANPAADLQHRMITLRHEAADAYRSAPRSPWPPEFDDPFPDVVGEVPEIAAAQLTSEIMGATIAHHGSLLVRGLFDRDQVERTRSSILASTEAQEAAAEERDPLHFDPVLGLDGMTAVLRKMVVERNGVWLADCPAATAQVIDDLTQVGVVRAIAEHFGERPVISLEKSTLRRVQPQYRFTGWHQDGSFLGPRTRAINIWVPLTPCGGDRPAPGLEVVPARIAELFDTDGGTGTASINGYAVHFWAKERGLRVIQPVVDPGDALIFDELMAHRTYLSETMTEERLALECWFFAPSNPAEKYVSLLV